MKDHMMYDSTDMKCAIKANLYRKKVGEWFPWDWREQRRLAIRGHEGSYWDNEYVLPLIYGIMVTVA